MSPQPDQGGSIRRYLALVQDGRGYPPRGEVEPAPPDGPEQPMIFSVVKADEHEAAVECLRTIIADLIEGETAEEGTPQWYALRNARAALDQEQQS